MSAFGFEAGPLRGAAARLPRARGGLLVLLAWVGLALTGSGCKDADRVTVAGEGPAADETLPAAVEGDYRVSTKADVQWKRHAALQADLARALELGEDELCNELGRARCIDQVHLAPLGGHDPFARGILESSAEPLATTPAVIDRVLLSACGRRASLDREAPRGRAVVFGRLDLGGAAPEPSDSAAQEAIRTLYRRLLARDPTREEVAMVAELAVDETGQAVSAVDFATLSCFAIGSSVEFLFY